MEAATAASPRSHSAPSDNTAGAPASPRDIVLLGSTGSIGTQAADIVARNPGRFRLTGLAAGGGHPELLARQALEHGVEVVAVASGRGRAGRRAGPGPAGSAIGRQAGCPRCWPGRTPWPRWPPGRAMSC